MQDVQAVYLSRIRPSDAEAQRTAANFQVELGTYLGREDFGVCNSLDPGSGLQNHRGGDHGARQRAPSCLVNTRHAQAAHHEATAGRSRRFARASTA